MTHDESARAESLTRLQMQPSQSHRPYFFFHFTSVDPSNVT